MEESPIQCDQHLTSGSMPGAHLKQRWEKLFFLRACREVTALFSFGAFVFGLLHAVRFHNLYFCAFCDSTDQTKYYLLLILQ